MSWAPFNGGAETARTSPLGWLAGNLEAGEIRGAGWRWQGGEKVGLLEVKQGEVNAPGDATGAWGESHTAIQQIHIHPLTPRSKIPTREPNNPRHPCATPTRPVNPRRGRANSPGDARLAEP
jgi:hypothetical protein